MREAKIKSFTDLIAWKNGHTIVLSIYSNTNNFPKNSFSLVDQMRRCSVSITSNIAEGFSRRSKKEKIQFYYTALGSVTELQNQLLIARDLKYISKDAFHELAQHTITVHKLIHGLIKSSRSHP